MTSKIISNSEGKGLSPCASEKSDKLKLEFSGQRNFKAERKIIVILKL